MKKMTFLRAHENNRKQRRPASSRARHVIRIYCQSFDMKLIKISLSGDTTPGFMNDKVTSLSPSLGSNSLINCLARGKSICCILYCIT